MACKSCEERQRKIMKWTEDAKAKLKLQIARLTGATARTEQQSTQAEQQGNRTKQPSDSD